MSGGYFGYNQYRINDIAEELEKVINNNGKQDVDEFGDKLYRNYSDETIEKFKQGLIVLKKASVYAQRIDWLLSCDDSEESFHRRLKEELGKL